jgi:predicted MFS family arabinose efflux permease
MEENQTKVIVGFSLLDGLYWGFYAVFVGYIATYLLDCGMSNSFLSIMLAVFMLCSFFGAFFWGGQCDKHHTNKKVFIPEFIAAVIVAFVIFFAAKWNLWIAAVLYPVFGFLSAPLGSNLDAWMLKRFHKDAGMYGKARAIGSFGYALVALIIGLLINAFGYIVMPIGIIVTAGMVLGMALVMQDSPYNGVEHIEHVNAAGLLKIRPYIYMVVILFMTGLACAPINNMKIVILKSVGGDVGVLGIDAFIGTTLQAVFMFLSGRLKKIPAYQRLVLMTGCIFVMMLFIMTAVNPVMIIISSIMWNISYGVMLPTVREITEKNVHGALKNTAHSMADAVYSSFAGIIALTYSGFVMDSFGAKSVAFLGFGLMIVPVIMSVAGMRQERKNITE